jgi:hypothetical protein
VGGWVWDLANERGGPSICFGGPSAKAKGGEGGGSDGKKAETKAKGGEGG